MLHIYLAYVDADQTDIHLKFKTQRSLGVKKQLSSYTLSSPHIIQEFRPWL